MKIELFCFLLLTATACNPDGGQVFSLEGKTKNLPDGTLVLLENPESKEVMDSAVVMAQGFAFRQKLPESPMLAIIRTENYSNYRFLWIENRNIVFDASQSDFSKALVSGSPTEHLNTSLLQELERLSPDEKQHRERTFIKENPKSIISAYLLSFYAVAWGKATTQELFDSFSNQNKDNRYGKKIASFLALSQNPGIGESYVDFALPDSLGNHKQLSEFEGKVVLLEFWASWCGPCRMKNPTLTKTYEKYRPQGFEIFAVSLDEKRARWLDAIREDRLPWLQVSDLQGLSSEPCYIYGVTKIPDNFLINRQGTIIARNIGGIDLEEKIKEAL